VKVVTVTIPTRPFDLKLPIILLVHAPHSSFTSVLVVSRGFVRKNTQHNVQV
jgi:hypothetical protein